MQRESIRRRLLRRLLAPLVLIGVLSGWATYWLSWIPARDAYDLALANAAWDLAAELGNLQRARSADLSGDFRRLLRSDRFDELYFSMEDRNGIRLAGDPGLPLRAIPHDLDRPRFYDASYLGQPVRVASVATLAEGEMVVVSVAETTAKRQGGQRKIMITLAVWGLALTLTIVTLDWILIGEGLAPLNRLREDLAQRSLQDLAPLDESRAPAEVYPLVQAINALLARIATAMSAQQGFLADVAHQLRTPLAGLLAQLAAARQRSLSPELERSIELMQSTADRTARLANQLLALARAESSGFHPERLRQLNLESVIRQHVDAWVWQADRKQIELHFDLQPTPILGDEFLIRELLENLLDNAVRYTPAGGRICIGCTAGEFAATVFVEDSGPGIPEAERSRIFEKFYRMPGTGGDGSGLGLAIVAEIARDHRASVRVLDASGAGGTRIEVRFPALRIPAA
jgi:two-component system sensor histidine kinase TctE